MTVTELHPGADPGLLAEATNRAGRIRRVSAELAGLDLDGLAADIAQAYQLRDWLVLGYPDWPSYVTGEFGSVPWILNGSRDGLVLAMHGAGMSTRAIEGTGLDSKSGAQRRIARTRSIAPAGAVAPEDDQEALSVPYSAPGTVTSLDGRKRPASRQERPRERASRTRTDGPGIRKAAETLTALLAPIDHRARLPGGRLTDPQRQALEAARDEISRVLAISDQV